MKELILVILLSVVFSCKSNNVQEVLNRKQFVEVLEQSILLSGITSSKISLYNEYDNNLNIDSVLAFYQYGSNIFGYEISDSITNYVLERKDNPIPRNINELSVLDIEVISDTLNFNEDYILISEPFLIDSNKMLFTMSNKNTTGKASWIFFFEKKQDSLILIRFYDFQKDRLYQREKPLVERSE